MAVGQIIGMGQRAGKLISGNFALKDALLKTKIRLLIIANDTAGRTKKELAGLADVKNIPVVFYSSKVELGRLIGKAPCSAVACTDEAMSRRISEALERGGANRTRL